MSRSSTVRGALRVAGEGPVPVTLLVDAVLERHAEYLEHWPTSPPAWPDGLFAQPGERWMLELEPLAATDLMFGRLAVLGWCLLDDRVATAASQCGILSAVVDGIRPQLADFLTPEGLRLLRRRAPAVALSAGLLPPDVGLLGLPGSGAIETIALARTPHGQRGIGLWAVSHEQQVFVGRGEQSSRVMEEAASAPATMSFSRQGDLHVIDRVGAVVQRYRPSDGRRVQDEWRPGEWIAASNEGAIATFGFDGGPRGTRLRAAAWGLTDGGGPVELPGLDDEVTRLAVAGKHVAAVAGDVVWVGGPDQEWWRAGSVEPTLSTIAADELGAAYTTSDGWVVARGWAQTVPDDAGAWTRVPALPGQEILCSARGGGRAVVASESEIALVRGGAVEARWRPEDGKHITAVAVSADGNTVAVAGTLMLRFWRLDGAGEMRLTSYTSDTAEGEDLLGVQPTVDALAAIVAARAVEPPLSVGLFGAWGSGKSFFMRRVEERVREITEESRSSGRPQSSMWAWRNIRHVRFNAWQYAAADVWAGLLEQLVGELAQRPKGRTLDLVLPPELSELEKNRVQRLAGAVSVSETAVDDLLEAQQRREDAIDVVMTAQQDLLTARAGVGVARRHAVRDGVGNEAVDALDGALAQAGLPPVGADLRDTWRQLEGARRSTESVGALLGGRRRFLVVAVAAAPLLGLVVALLLVWASASAPWLTGAVTALVTVVAASAAWLNRSATDLQAQVAKIEAAQAQARAVEIDARAKQVEAQQALGKAELSVEQARLDAELAEQEVASAQAKVLAVTPGALVEEYLEGRQESEDYRAMLGLIGTVRRDLDVVSRGVEAHNRDLSSDPEAGLDDVVNRVVLYVDDLDRCRPEVVVKVLEAVSMLMSFPLFVVVVAVDSHWISRSLKAVYKDMLVDGEVTPEHYLEKIFQLPVWLDRPEADAARTMARALMGDTGDTGDTGDGGSPTDAPGTDAESAPVTPTPAVAAPAPREAGEAPRNIALATTPPESVTLESSETAAIAGLAPLLTRSPRALKRYLNTYRLVKALVDPADLGLARVLLAVAIGRPELGERLFTLIRPGAEQRTVGDAIEQLPEFDRVWLSLIGDQSWRRVECSEAWPVGQRVRRFVFRSETGRP